MSKITFRTENQIYTADLGNYKVSYSGIATPFGIRIYTPLAEAGVTNFQMYLTGAINGLIIFLCQFAIEYWQITNGTIIDTTLKSLIATVLFMLVMKFTPLASIHASEHQIIHAMENGSELNHDSVKLQNRVHPRCGTNLMALFLMLVLFANLMKYMPSASPVQVLVFTAATVLSLITHTSIGGFLQSHFTTKPARPQDIDRAIEIGIEHNTKLVECILQNDTPSKLTMFFMLIAHSGIVPVFSGLLSSTFIMSYFFTIPGR